MVIVYLHSKLHNTMNILILGSGGREHAFALKLAESNKVNQLFVAPGNAGTHKIATNILKVFHAIVPP